MRRPPAIAADHYVASKDIREWSGVISDTFSGLSARAVQPGQFSASLALRELANITIARVRSSAVSIHHEGSTAPPTDGRFLVKTQLSGESEICTGANIVHMRPGDFIVCDTARAFSLCFDQETEIISIPIPARFLERFAPHPEAVAFQPSNRALAAHGVVSDYLQSLLRVHNLSASHRHAAQLRDTYFELLILAFEHCDPGGRALSTTQSCYLERAKGLIDQRLEDETLNIDDIAHTIGISKRYLHTVFSAAGSSVSRYIMTARLAHAARLLRAERTKKTTIAEIAYRCGFKSVAHFARTFKAHYHETPIAYRERTFG